MQLSDICEINPKTTLTDETIDVSFVGMQDVSDNGAIYTENVRPYLEVKKGYTSFEEGDVLFAKITPCMENGKGAVAKGLINGKGAGSTEFHVLRPIHNRAYSEWLYYLTLFKGFRKSAELAMTGSAGQKRVPKTFLENYTLDIPDIKEQEQQANALNCLRSIISQREQQLKEYDDLIKARFVELFGDPVVNPKGWEKKNLSDEADIKIGPFGSLLHKEDYVVGGHALINPSHIIDGKIVPAEELTVSDQKYEELSAYHLLKGDVVMGRRGEM